MTDYSPFIETVKDYKTYALASMAECSGPDSHESEGALFLKRVRDSFVEALEWEAQDNGDMTPAQMAEHLRDGEALSEAADGAPSVYTFTLWQQFTDLGAWQEDLDEWGGSGDDMTANAIIALYGIARRLLDALTQELEEWETEEWETEEEEGEL